jgi:hypothetical protein
MVTPVSSQPAPASRPQDNEPKNEPPPKTAASEPKAEPATSSADGPQPTPGGTNVNIHAGAPGAGGGAINNPSADRFQSNGRESNISA